MTTLDDERLVKSLDSNNILQNFRDFPDQIEGAWNDCSRIPIPTTFLKAREIVLTGMGGSAIGAALIEKLVEQTCPIPVRVHRDTTPLKTIGPDTLLIASSYSGLTEETLTVFEYAARHGAKLINIGTDTTLASLGRKYRSTAFMVDYGGETRAAFGYMFTPLIYIFSKLGWLALGKEELKEAIVLLRGLDAKLHPGIQTYQNQAKQLAERLKDKYVVIIGSGAMGAVARRFTQDIAENAKQFAAFLPIPEMQHNAISSFDFPKETKTQLRVLLLESKYTDPRNRVRETMIGQILQRKRIGYETLFMHPSAGQISEVLQMIYMSAMSSYYLALLNGVDPSQVPVQSKIKEQLTHEQ